MASRYPACRFRAWLYLGFQLGAQACAVRHRGGWSVRPAHFAQTTERGPGRRVQQDVAAGDRIDDRDGLDARAVGGDVFAPNASFRIPIDAHDRPAHDAVAVASTCTDSVVASPEYGAPTVVFISTAARTRSFPASCALSRSTRKSNDGARSCAAAVPAISTSAQTICRVMAFPRSPVEWRVRNRPGLSTNPLQPRAALGPERCRRRSPAALPLAIRTGRCWRSRAAAA